MKKICIITGASQGLGKELAKQMLLKGYNLALISRTQSKLEKTKEELLKLSDKDILIFDGDISDEKFVKSVYENISKKYQLKFLFNNAAVGRFAPVEQNNRKLIDEVLAGSLIGTMLMSTHALPLLKQSEDLGIIVNIISMAALKGYKMESAYGAAKWGQRGYAEVLRAETFGTNIKVINIFPGGINTGFWEENRNYVPKGIEKTFINPAELAQIIVDNATNKESLIIKDLVVEQKHMNLE